MIQQTLSFTEFGASIGKSAAAVSRAVVLGRISRACIAGSRVIDPARAAREFEASRRRLTLTAATTLASYVPALRATSIDPIEALRSE